MSAWRGIRLAMLTTLLMAAIFLLLNRPLVDGNLHSLRKGKIAVVLQVDKLSAALAEADVKALLPQVPLRCDPLGREDIELGDRVCDADIRSFNGVRAYRLAFFFRDGALDQFKVDIPWWHHRDMGRQLLKDYGLPTGIQDTPAAGVRLAGWRLATGNILYNRDPDMNPLWWNTLHWLSHPEASRMGGVFVAGKAPTWKERKLLDVLMFLVAVAVE